MCAIGSGSGSRAGFGERIVTMQFALMALRVKAGFGHVGGVVTINTWSIANKRRRWR